MHRNTTLCLVFVLLTFTFCFGASEFGKNKVQYEYLNWNYYKAPHFSVYYHQDQGTLSQSLFQWIDTVYSHLSNRFSFVHREPIPIIVYGSPTLFQQTNIITELIPEAVGGFTELFKSRVVVPFDGSYGNLHHVLNHEMVHAFEYGILYDQLGGSLLMNTGVQTPLWLMEGLAEFLSTGWDIEADMFLMDKVINSSIPLPGPELDGYMAYKGGQSFLYYLSSVKGDSAFTDFLLEFKRSKSVDAAIRKVYKSDLEALGKEWIQELRRIYWPEIGQRLDPRRKARAITSHLESHDHFNLRPRISPDGSKIAFFSDRQDFTKILICDRKGKVLQTISQNGYSGFFESFHPFRTGMCWSPDGKRLAVVTLCEGKDEIRLIDITAKQLSKRIRTDLNSISSPDWSRDGSFLVFTGMSEGQSDLYKFDLKKDSLTRLTNDNSNEADPRISPDSKTVIFSIEDTVSFTSANKQTSPYSRFSTDLAQIDISSHKTVRITSSKWNEKYPTYSPDGKHIVFVSDRNGIDNMYVGHKDSLDKALPITDYIGGCMHPDWANDGSIVFGLFNNQGWDIWLMDKPFTKVIQEPLRLTNYVQSLSDSTGHFFNPEAVPDTNDLSKKRHSKNDVEKMKSSGASITEVDISGQKAEKPAKTVQTTSDTLVLTINSSTQNASILNSVALNKDSSKDSISVPIDTSKQIKIVQFVKEPNPYHLKFSPDIMTLGVGVSTFYGYAGQWMMGLSDVMGDHRITLAGDVQGQLDKFMHLYASYMYLKNRMDFGIGIFYNRDYTSADLFGDSLYHDIDFGGFLLARYPFSMDSRIDLQFYARHIDRKPFEFSGNTISSNTFLPSLSYVYDNILWGITGPLNGFRGSAKVLVSPPVAFIDNSFASFDLDLRMYFHFLNRFVWANRVFTGVSTGLRNDQSARRYFLGGNDNWLFYGVNLNQYEKNIPNTFYSDFVTPFRGWKFLGLTGNKAAVLNSEFRFPFVREVSIAWPMSIDVRYINGAVFIDAGNAWDYKDEIKELPLPRKIYGGIGFGLRANLGIFVLRFDRGWPTDWQSTGTPINYFSLGAEF